MHNKNSLIVNQWLNVNPPESLWVCGPHSSTSFITLIVTVVFNTTLVFMWNMSHIWTLQKCENWLTKKREENACVEDWLTNAATLWSVPWRQVTTRRKGKKYIEYSFVCQFVCLSLCACYSKLVVTNHARSWQSHYGTHCFVAGNRLTVLALKFMNGRSNVCIKPIMLHVNVSWAFNPQTTQT